MAGRSYLIAVDVGGTFSDAIVLDHQGHWGPVVGWRDTAICRGQQLAPGMEVEGPLVVELETTTVPVPPGHKLDHGRLA